MELKEEVYKDLVEISRKKISELQDQVFMLESHIQILQNNNSDKYEVLDVPERESLKGEIKELKRKLDLVIIDRDKYKDELDMIKSPYDSVIEVEKFTNTFAHN